MNFRTQPNITIAIVIERRYVGLISNRVASILPNLKLKKVELVVAATRTIGALLRRRTSSS